MDDEDPPTQKDPELQTLFSGLDPSFLPLTSSGLFLGEDSGDQLLELGDKGRNRVFLMARQYSQKIKKANQLLKMKSMDHEPSCTRTALRTNKAKDLAAILEEKKQGGAAIGKLLECMCLFIPLCAYIVTFHVLWSLKTHRQ